MYVCLNRTNPKSHKRHTHAIWFCCWKGPGGNVLLIFVFIFINIEGHLFPSQPQTYCLLRIISRWCRRCCRWFYIFSVEFYFILVYIFFGCKFYHKKSIFQFCWYWLSSCCCCCCCAFLLNKFHMFMTLSFQTQIDNQKCLNGDSSQQRVRVFVCFGLLVDFLRTHSHTPKTYI